MAQVAQYSEQGTECAAKAWVVVDPLLAHHIAADKFILQVELRDGREESLGYATRCQRPKG